MSYNESTEVPSQRMPPVGEAMTRFDFEVASLSKSIEQLTERLQPVLMPENPRPAPPRMNELKSEGANVPLSSALHNQIDRLNNQTQRIEDLRQRIGV